jgi:hypothetical protein
MWTAMDDPSVRELFIQILHNVRTEIWGCPVMLVIQL